MKINIEGHREQNKEERRKKMKEKEREAIAVCILLIAWNPSGELDSPI